MPTTPPSHIQRITLLGAASNILLSIIKIYGGIVGHSHALISDGLHSLADLLTDCAVLFAARLSAQKADAHYPYGYARVETLATVALAILLILTGVGILYDAGKSVFIPGDAMRPASFVAYIAIFSFIIKEVLFRLTLKYAKKLQSSLLLANAWHHRTDAATSLVVLIGIIGALLGYLHFDAFAACIVAIMIIKMGWELTATAVKELIDVGFDAATLAHIQKSTLAVANVRAIHQLRTRSMGGRIFLDMHILVSPHLTVSEGHYIAARVHRELIRLMPAIADVTIHVDPEDDENVPDDAHSVLDLPTREAFLPILRQHWQDLLPPEAFKKIKLDYLSGKISITVNLPAAKMPDLDMARELLKKMKAQLNHLSYVNNVVLSINVGL